MSFQLDFIKSTFSVQFQLICQSKWFVLPFSHVFSLDLEHRFCGKMSESEITNTLILVGIPKSFTNGVCTSNGIAHCARISFYFLCFWEVLTLYLFKGTMSSNSRFGDFGLDLWSRTIWSWTIRTLWFWTINNLEKYSKFKWSRTIFEKHTAPGAYRKHAPGAVCIFKYGPGAYLALFDLEIVFRSWMVQDHKVLMV